MTLGTIEAVLKDYFGTTNDDACHWLAVLAADTFVSILESVHHAEVEYLKWCLLHGGCRSRAQRPQPPLPDAVGPAGKHT